MERIDQDHRPSRPTVVTIGNFDGVNIGHQALLRRAQAESRKHHLDMVVMTFDPHPMTVLRPQMPLSLITPTDLKLHYLAEAGVPWVDILAFTKDLAMVPPLAFLQLYLVERLKVQSVVIGYNFTFGSGGTGNADTIQKWGQAQNIAVHVIDPIQDQEPAHKVVSSTRIRQLIKEGQVTLAKGDLGHPFAVQASVVAGDARGRQLGIPTANIFPPSNQIMPPFGVYSGFLNYRGTSVEAVANWGVRPTFAGSDPVLEVHILDGTSWSFDEPVRFDFIEHLRPEIKFASPGELVHQIEKDVERARTLLRKARPR